MRAPRSTSAVVLSALVAAAAILLAACPPPVMREVLVYAQDKIPPVITVTAPVNRSPFDSSITFIGVVTDAAVAAGDGHGKVASLTYTVVDHESLGDTAQLTTDGAFSFTIDTRGLSGDQAVVITATDWIGNSSTVRVEVVDPGVGPDIAISSPQASSVYLSTVAVIGVVNNRGDSVDVGEVASLRYEVLGSPVQGDVTFSATDGSFSFPFSTVTLRGRITIRLTAMDRNGRTSRADLELLDRSDGPTLTIGSPEPYSSYQAAVTVVGTVTNNGDAASTSEVDALSYQVLGKTAVTAVNFAANTGAFSFGFSTVGMIGNIIVQISAKDKNNRSTTVDYSLLEDRNGPSIVINPPLDGTSYQASIELAGSVRNSSADLTGFDDVDRTSLAYRIGTDNVAAVALDSSCSFHVSIPTIGRSGAILINLSVRDLNGHVSEKSLTLLDNIPGPQIAVSSAPQAYSSERSQAVLVVGTVSTLTPPLNLKDNGMGYRVQCGSTSYPLAYIGVTNLSPNSADFAFSFNPTASGMTGYLTVTIVAVDQGGRTTEKTVNLNDDVVAPRILLEELATDNSSMVVTFSEPVYTTSTGAGGLQSTDFAAEFSSNGGAATMATLGTVTRIEGGAPAGGEQSLRVALSYGGAVPSGSETLRILPTDGSAIYDQVGNPVSVTQTITARSLYDRAYPAVTTVRAETADGVYNAGDPIVVLVTYSEPVFVVAGAGTPYITLDTGGAGQRAYYQSGSGTDTLRFRFVVAAGDNSSDLDCVPGSQVEPNGSTIRDASLNTAGTTLPVGSLAGSAAIRIDTTAPAVTVARAGANGAYRAGQSVLVDLSFGEPVWVTGAVTFGLTTAATATYVSGSGTSTLRFSSTVSAGENSNDLDTNGTLSFAAGTIRDEPGNDAGAAIPTGASPSSLASQSAVVIDTTPPSVSSITSNRATGLYGLGTVFSFTLTLSEAVTVTGSPTFGLSNGGTASYFSGSPGAALVFRYTVSTGDTNVGDLDASGSITLASSMVDAAGNATSASLPVGATSGSLASGYDIATDASTPSVTSITSDWGTGAYGLGKVFLLTVHFTEAVNVTGTPSFPLNAGGVATYYSGTGSANPVFRYVVASGYATSDLDATGPITPAGSIADPAGNPATLALPTGGASGAIAATYTIAVDAVAPVVTDITCAPGTGSYCLGQAFTIMVHFDEAVYVDVSGGSPSIALNNSGTATYSGGTGTDALSFSYAVGSGQAVPLLDTNGAIASPQRVTDALSNQFGGTLPMGAGDGRSLVGGYTIVIDLTAPTLLAVQSTSGMYAAGDDVLITLYFDEAVEVSGGSPSFGVTTGGTATYDGTGSGTRYLEFRYTVAGGQNSADLDTNGIIVSSSIITDHAGNAVSATLPTGATSGSLQSGYAVVIDTLAPVVEEVYVGDGSSSLAYGIGQTLQVKVQFNEVVSYTGSLKTLALALGSTRYADFLSGDNSKTLVFSYLVTLGDTATDMDYTGTNAFSGTVSDGRNSTADLSLPSPGQPHSISAEQTVTVN